MYYQCKALQAYDLELMRLIVEEHLRILLYGSRRMSVSQSSGARGEL